ESVGRLVIVPDDALHQVPFAALRKGSGEEPLVARYEIAVAPSATLWLRWRRTATQPAARSALVLADPRTVRGGDGLGALPHAREEGRQVVRRLRSLESCTSPRTPWWTTSGRSAPRCSWRPGATARTGCCSCAR